MDLDRPKELIRQAVIRDGHRCSICGRPCSEDEARRHSEPGAFGDSAMSFAAMCYACQTWLAHEGMKPAQHITHFYDASKARWTLRRFSRGMRKVIIAGSLTTFAIASIVIHQTAWNAVVTASLLLLTAYSISTRIFDAIRYPGPRLHVHHSHDQQSVNMEQQR